MCSLEHSLIWFLSVYSLISKKYEEYAEREKNYIRKIENRDQMEREKVPQAAKTMKEKQKD